MRGWVIGVAAPAGVVLGALVAPLAWATISVPQPSARAVDAAVVIGGTQPAPRSTADMSTGTGEVNRPQTLQTPPAAPGENGDSLAPAASVPGHGDNGSPAAGATAAGPPPGTGTSAAPPSSTAPTAAPVSPEVVTGNPVHEVGDDASADDDPSETGGAGSTSRGSSTTSARHTAETSDDG